MNEATKPTAQVIRRIDRVSAVKFQANPRTKIIKQNIPKPNVAFIVAAPYNCE